MMYSFSEVHSCEIDYTDRSKHLRLDEACLILNNTDNTQNLTLWAQSEECYKVIRYFCILSYYSLLYFTLISSQI